MVEVVFFIVIHLIFIQNGCNHEILCFWGANVDFQFVLYEYSTVMYVSSYMMKSEKAIDEFLKSVTKECYSELVEEQLKKMGKAFAGNHIVGTPDASLSELSMWLMRNGRRVMFVNSHSVMTMLVYHGVLVPWMIWKR